MLDERYEIRGKIGQGGVGAVYRAWDTRLSREVAIKRVLADGGYETQEDAVAYLLKEATSLSSVQHPHIVTVFDAGVDDEGPFVVMELLEGRTIDEMIERGSLVMEDFREVALQTQEALIAAQDLDLVHRDLKPTNVMVTWLASGKFQVKLVDFGLAKFHPKPSVQTIDHGDAVFGSIHFMAPEQFERTPLDQRTDMYAIGCLYYFCLTGLYPFNGDTAPDVMTAHLHHEVTPLAELRPDLPSWVCQWVMWHIARDMADRPPGAREALQNFLEMEQAMEAAPDQGTAPQFVFSEEQQIRTPAPASPPTTAVVHHSSIPPTTGVVMTKTTPQPLAPPQGRKPSIHTTSHVTASQPPNEPPSEPTADAEPTEPEVPVAKPATPPAGAKISLRNPTAPPLATAAAKPNLPAKVTLATGTPATVPVATAVPVAAAAAAPPAPANDTVITGSTEIHHQSGLSIGAKIAIGAILAVLILFVGSLVMTRISSNRENKLITKLVSQVEDPTARDIPVSKSEATLLLDRVSTIGSDSQRQAIYQLLSLAKSSDGSDLDVQIASYAANSERQMSENLRRQLFKVIRLRRGPSAFPYLLAYSKKTDDPEMAAAALQAAEKLAAEEHVPELLGVIQFAEDSAVQQAAEAALASLAERSSSREFLSQAILADYDSAPNDDVRHIYLRLLGTAGGPTAEGLALKALNSDNQKDQLASIASIRSWADDSMFEELLNFISGEEDDFVRTQAFNAAYSFLKLPRERSPAALKKLWIGLTASARTEKEKILMINGLATLPDEWALDVIKSFLEDENDRVILRAEQAKDYIEDRRKQLDTSKKGQE